MAPYAQEENLIMAAIYENDIDVIHVMLELFNYEIPEIVAKRWLTKPDFRIRKLAIKYSPIEEVNKMVLYQNDREIENDIDTIIERFEGKVPIEVIDKWLTSSIPEVCELAVEIAPIEKVYTVAKYEKNAKVIYAIIKRFDGVIPTEIADVGLIINDPFIRKLAVQYASIERVICMGKFEINFNVIIAIIKRLDAKIPSELIDIYAKHYRPEVRIMILQHLSIEQLIDKAMCESNENVIEAITKMFNGNVPSIVVDKWLKNENPEIRLYAIHLATREQISSILLVEENPHVIKEISRKLLEK